MSERHRWVQPLGIKTWSVNGADKTVPAVCSRCLIQSTDQMATEQCDRLIERMAHTQEAAGE
jgi:hypothetical protein